MNKFQEHIDKIEEFKRAYVNFMSRELTRFEDICISTMDAYNVLRSDLKYEHEIKNHLNKLNDVSEICNYKDILGSLHASIFDTYCRPPDQYLLTSVTNEMENMHCSLTDCFFNIEKFLEDISQQIQDNINNAYQEMINCPYGMKQNRKKNANNFERSAVELFSWLFLGDVKLIEAGKSNEHYTIVKRKLRRDAMFEVHKNINVDPVLKNYNFLHFIIECKNFAKPDYTALLQAYAYMLFERMLLHDDDNTTLCIILSRENPGDYDVVIKMRDRLCEVNKNLMIIFMSVNDVGNMINERLINKKPSKIIYDLIRKTKTLSKTAEYY